MQNELNKNAEKLNYERRELKKLKEDFVKEVDKRVKERLSEWEANSVTSLGRSIAKSRFYNESIISNIQDPDGPT